MRLVLRQIDNFHARVAERAVALATMILGGDCDFVVLLVVVNDLRVSALLMLDLGLNARLLRLQPTNELACLFG